jgi:hypothetical protein
LPSLVCSRLPSGAGVGRSSRDKSESVFAQVTDDEKAGPGMGSILVVFLEDRNGKALVRLPNGSKTSLLYESLDFVVSVDGLERPVSGDDLVRGPLLEPHRRSMEES